jgi:hypothetical protein
MQCHAHDESGCDEEILIEKKQNAKQSHHSRNALHPNLCKNKQSITTFALLQFENGRNV